MTITRPSRAQTSRPTTTDSFPREEPGRHGRADPDSTIRSLRKILLTLMALAALIPSDRVPNRNERRVTHEKLNAVLWMQSSAEYEACARQSYSCARNLLLRGLADPTLTAATEQTSEYAHLPPAIVLDLDETVLANAPYQAWLARYEEPYRNDNWSPWAREARAGAVPGAREFLRFASAQRVAIFYVTNRHVTLKGPTVANLRALGMPVDPDGRNVLCTGERPTEGGAPWKSDKSGRRAYLVRRYRIVLMVGDQLGDFVSDEGLGPEQRAELARRYESFWGERWITTPNPSYGGWDDAIARSDRSLSDGEVLACKFKTLRIWGDPTR